MTFTDYELERLEEIFSLDDIDDLDEHDQQIPIRIGATIAQCLVQEKMEALHKSPALVQRELDGLKKYLGNLSWQARGHLGTLNSKLEEIEDRLDVPFEKMNPSKYRRDFIKKFFIRYIAVHHTPYSQKHFIELVQLVLDKCDMPDNASRLLYDALGGYRPDYPYQEMVKDFPDHW